MTPPAYLVDIGHGAEIYVWAVHVPGWQQLGWQLLSQVDSMLNVAALQEGQEPTPLLSEELAAVPTAELMDYGAMTKAEIIEHCSTHYGVLLDATLTKAALVHEAQLLSSSQPLPDALMDDLMT